MKDSVSVENRQSSDKNIIDLIFIFQGPWSLVVESIKEYIFVNIDGNRDYGLDAELEYQMADGAEGWLTLTCLCLPLILDLDDRIVFVCCCSLLNPSVAVVR
jgi:hypothetical protein